MAARGCAVPDATSVSWAEKSDRSQARFRPGHGSGVNRPCCAEVRGSLGCASNMRTRAYDGGLADSNYCAVPKRLEYRTATFQLPSSFTQTSVMRASAKELDRSPSPLENTYRPQWRHSRMSGPAFRQGACLLALSDGLLFWQAHLLAKSLHPRIAANQS